MHSRVPDAIFLALVVSCCAATTADGADLGNRFVHSRHDCVRTPLAHEQYASEQVDSSLLRPEVEPSVRQGDGQSPGLIPEEVPVPSAVWLAAIGFGFAGSVLRRRGD